MPAAMRQPQRLPEPRCRTTRPRPLAGLRTWLLDRALPLWLAQGVDHAAGGFVEFLQPRPLHLRRAVPPAAGRRAPNVGVRRCLPARRERRRRGRLPRHRFPHPPCRFARRRLRAALRSPQPPDRRHAGSLRPCLCAAGPVRRRIGSAASPAARPRPGARGIVRQRLRASEHRLSGKPAARPAAPPEPAHALAGGASCGPRGVRRRGISAARPRAGSLVPGPPDRPRHGRAAGILRRCAAAAAHRRWFRRRTRPSLRMGLAAVALRGTCRPRRAPRGSLPQN